MNDEKKTEKESHRPQKRDSYETMKQKEKMENSMKYDLFCY